MLPNRSSIDQGIDLDVDDTSRERIVRHSGMSVLLVAWIGRFASRICLPCSVVLIPRSVRWTTRPEPISSAATLRTWVSDSRDTSRCRMVWKRPSR